MNLRFEIEHFFFSSLELVGMRDRLRCPACRAVGTWKPHGSIFDDNTDHRWTCKWCGHYRNARMTARCFPCPVKKVWSLPREPDSGLPVDGPTPKDILDRSEIGGANPWFG